MRALMLLILHMILVQCALSIEVVVESDGGVVVDRPASGGTEVDGIRHDEQLEFLSKGADAWGRKEG